MSARSEEPNYTYHRKSVSIIFIICRPGEFRKMFHRSLVFFAAITAALGVIFMTDFSTDAVAAEGLSNPLTEKWVGPYGGVPPFDKIKVADFKPALETAMAENLAEIDAIANNPAAPTFENTFVPLEKSGDTLSRVSVLFGIWSNNKNSKEFEPVQAEMQPKLAAHYDKITQNAALFRRIAAVYSSPDTKKLNAEQQRLVKVYYDNFVHAGAKLDSASKERLAKV